MTRSGVVVVSGVEPLCCTSLFRVTILLLELHMVVVIGTTHQGNGALVKRDGQQKWQLQIRLC